MDWSAQEAKFGPLSLKKDDTRDRINQSLAQLNQPKKRSGISKWLPTALAVGGTLAAAPFTGGTSLLGTAALLGGGAAVGGGLGELGAQTLSGENTNLGKAAKEALISGATGAIPIGGAAKAAKVARTAKAGEQAVAQTAPKAEVNNFLKRGLITPNDAKFYESNAAKISGAPAAVATPEVTTQPAKGFVTRTRENAALHGQQMEARSGGYSVNSKLPGSRELDIAGSKAVSQTLKDNGIKTGSPLNRLQQVETKLTEHGSKIDQALTKDNIKLAEGDRQAIADHYLREVEKLPGVDDTIRGHAQSIASNFVKTGGNDVKGLVNFRRGLDKDLISYISNPDAALAGKQQAAKVARQTLSKVTERLAPGIKDPNQAYSKLVDAKGYLVKGTGEMNTRGGIIGRIAESGPIKTAEAKVGDVLQKIGGEGATATANTTKKGLLSKVAREGIKQEVGGAVLPVASDLTLGTNLSGDTPPDASQVPPEAVPPVDPNAPPDTSALGDPNATDPSQTDQTQANLDAAIQKALASGDTKGLSNLLAVASYYEKKNAVDKPKPLNTTQQQQANNANSGLSALKTLQDEITKNPNALAKSATPGQTLPLVGGYITGATGQGVLRTARKEAADVISRLRTGAAINKQEEEFYISQLPKAGDSQETISYKMGLLSNLFSSFANPQSTGGSDVTDLLANAGAGQ